MIMMMAKHGNNDYAFRSDADVKRLFAAAGYEFAAVVQACRRSGQAVPLVENVIPASWSVTGGATVAIVDSRTGQELTKVKGPGTYVPYHYWGRFEDAAREFRRSLDTASIGGLESWVSSSIASVEAYVAHRVWLYNSLHPEDPLIDSKHHKVPFDKKIDDWIPQMSGGRKLDKGRQNWAHFGVLRSFRDKVAIHPKDTAVAIDYSRFCQLLNMFRSGIAGLLVDLHLHFGERIPCIILRYARLGDIELFTEKE